MSDPLMFISVVRDQTMYDRCVRNNPNVNRHQLVRCDNSIENKGIPFRYNEFLNGYDFNKPAWFIFCHEDFECLEDISDRVGALDPRNLYGPIGAITKRKFGVYFQWCLLGEIIQSDKNITAPKPQGAKVQQGTPVDTFDCQCLIVHSDLIKQTNLRFDEQLSFDLYVEDFCIQAKEYHSIPSLIFPIKCHHQSDSTASARYHSQEAYLNGKYPHCCYTGTSSYAIGKPCLLHRLQNLLKQLLLRLST